MHVAIDGGKQSGRNHALSMCLWICVKIAWLLFQQLKKWKCYCSILCCTHLYSHGPEVVRPSWHTNCHSLLHTASWFSPVHCSVGPRGPLAKPGGGQGTQLARVQLMLTCRPSVPAAAVSMRGTASRWLERFSTCGAPRRGRSHNRCCWGVVACFGWGVKADALH